MEDKRVLSISKKISLTLTACACAVLAGCGATTSKAVKSDEAAASTTAATTQTIRDDGFHSDWSVAHNILAAGGIDLSIQDAIVDEQGNIVKPLQGDFPRQPAGIVWLPQTQMKTYEEGAAWLQQNFANAMADGLAAQQFTTAYGVAVKSPTENRPWVKGAAIVFANPKLGCPQPPKSSFGKAPGEGFCVMVMNTADIAQPEMAQAAPAWMDKNTPLTWRYSRIGIGVHVPQEVKINMPELLRSISEKLPGGVFLYMPPTQTEQGLTAPFLLNRGKVLPFALPQQTTANK